MRNRNAGEEPAPRSDENPDRDQARYRPVIRFASDRRHVRSFDHDRLGHALLDQHHGGTLDGVPAGAERFFQRKHLVGAEAFPQRFALLGSQCPPFWVWGFDRFVRFLAPFGERKRTGQPLAIGACSASWKCPAGQTYSDLLGQFAYGGVQEFSWVGLSNRRDSFFGSR